MTNKYLVKIAQKTKKTSVKPKNITKPKNIVERKDNLVSKGKISRAKRKA